LAVTFAPIFNIDAEDRLHCFLAVGKRVIADTGEGDLVGRRTAWLWAADAITRVADLTHETNRTRSRVTRQAGAEQAVELTYISVARGVEGADEAVLLQVAVMFPLARDTDAVRRERCFHGQGSPDLPAMADEGRRGSRDAGCLRSVKLLVAPTRHTAADSACAIVFVLAAKHGITSIIGADVAVIAV